MSKRSALEQDVIDFAESLTDIFDRQLELQKAVSELFREIGRRASELRNSSELSDLSSFGVNKRAGSLAKEDKRKGNISFCRSTQRSVGPEM